MNSYIAEPVPLDADVMKLIADRLREVGFDEKHCAGRLGTIDNLPDLTGSRVARPYLGPQSDKLDIAIALFLLNEKVPLEKAPELFSRPDLDALRAMALIEMKGGEVYSQLNLVPCFGNYVATDRSSFGQDELPGINRVMWLYHESFALAGLVDRTTRLRAALDLGTGSGVHALLASRHCEHAIGVDVNPRAIAFSRFNQRLNGLNNIDIRIGDLYGPVAGLRFDLILSNPPYNPSPSVRAGSDYWSGGPSGEDILGRVIRGIDTHLTETGICHIITLLCHRKSGPSYLQKLDSWLTGGIHRYDVMAQVVAHQGYFANVDSEKHRVFLNKHFARFEFGVISIRRSLGRAGFYYHGEPRRVLPFFDEQGRCVMSINHSFFDSCREDMSRELSVPAPVPGVRPALS